VIEGIASMAASFLMLTLLVQVSLAMSARSAADAAVVASAHRAALPGIDLAAEAEALEAEIAALIPGARQVEVAVTATSTVASATARVKWAPPGPVLTPFWIRATAEVPRAVPP
jgi:hypothetical protein